MIEWIILLFAIVSLYFFLQYYYKPKAEILRYKAIFHKLGYKVYLQPFAFMGFSFSLDMERGMKKNKDALYIEKTVYSQIDVSIGNIIDKPVIIVVNPDLTKEFFSTNSNNSYVKYETMIQGTKEILGDGLVFS